MLNCHCAQAWQNAGTSQQLKAVIHGAAVPWHLGPPPSAALMSWETGADGNVELAQGYGVWSKAARPCKTQSVGCLDLVDRLEIWFSSHNWTHYITEINQKYGKRYLTLYSYANQGYLFDQKYNKNSNIVKYYYNLK